MFAFLIDDSAWVEIGGGQFAPGFFFWNSEVSRRTVGVESFWYQHIYANHIVWDAIEVASYSRKHTANVDDAVQEIRSIISRLAANRLFFCLHSLVVQDYSFIGRGIGRAAEGNLPIQARSASE